MNNAQKIPNVSEGSKPFVLSEILGGGKSVIYITYNEPHMEQIAKVLPFFVDGVEILTFAGWDCLPYDKVSVNSAVMNSRITTLAKLADSKPNRIILTTVSAVLQKIPQKKVIQSAYMELKKGSTVDRDDLINFLITNGYSRLGKVVEVGEFSVRGSIIDIFPPSCEAAYRLDFFGDTLENIRTFDPMTQISNKSVEKISLLPTSEIILTRDAIEKFRSKYRELFGTAKKDDALYNAISEGVKYHGMEHWLPLFYDKLDTLFDYLPDANIVLDTHTGTAIKERLATIKEYYQARLEAGNIKHKILNEAETFNPLPPEMLYIMEDKLEKIFNGKTVIEFGN